MAALAALVAGCASAPTPPPSADALTSPAAARPSTATPPSVSIPGPSPSSPGLTFLTEPYIAPPYDPPSIPPMAGEPFDIAWRSVAARGAPFGQGYIQGGRIHTVRWGEGAVAAYRTFDDEGPDVGPQIWRSADLVEWHRVARQEAGSMPIDVVRLFAGGPGLVALADDNEGGRALLVSPDGELWDTQRKLPPIETIWARPGLIVGIGQDTWLSGDGHAWWRAGPSPISTSEAPGEGKLSVAVDDGGGAIAFFEFWDTKDDSDERIAEVWRLTPDGRWTFVSELGDVEVDRAIRGPNGIVVLGWDNDAPGPRSWFSPDGRAWESAPGPPGAGTLATTPAGYVLTSQRSYYKGCDGYAPSAQVAQTWTSHDGLAWQMMPEQLLLDHTDLWFATPEEDRLVALGLRWSGTSDADGLPTFEPVAFAADLPKPEPSHTPLPEGGGCGGDE